MGDVTMVIPCDGVKNKKAFAALLIACLHLKKAIVIRYVYQETSAPKLCSLWPH